MNSSGVRFVTTASLDHMALFMAPWIIPSSPISTPKTDPSHRRMSPLFTSGTSPPGPRPAPPAGTTTFPLHTSAGCACFNRGVVYCGHPRLGVVLIEAKGRQKKSSVYGSQQCRRGSSSGQCTVSVSRRLIASTVPYLTRRETST